MTPRFRAFDAVLCDLDNVVRFYDFGRLAVLERASGLTAGLTASVAYSPELDLPLLLGRIDAQEWTDAVAERMTAYAPPARARELARAMADAPFHAEPEAVALLRRLRDVMPLVIVTNATAGLREELDAMGIGDLTPHVVNSAWEGVAKPDPEILLTAARLAGVAPERCLFVDDRAENTEAAAGLGMSTVRYRSVEDLRRALEPLFADSGAPVTTEAEVSTAPCRATARPRW